MCVLGLCVDRYVVCPADHLCEREQFHGGYSGQHPGVPVPRQLPQPLHERQWQGQTRGGSAVRHHLRLQPRHPPLPAAAAPREKGDSGTTPHGLLPLLIK